MILWVKRVEGVLLMVWKGGGGICFFSFVFLFYSFSFFSSLFSCYYFFIIFCFIVIFLFFLFFLLKILKFLDQIFFTANLARLVVVFWLKAHGISLLNLFTNLLRNLFMFRFFFSFLSVLHLLSSVNSCARFL